MASSQGNSIEIGQSEQELVTPKNEGRLRKRLCWAFIMLVLVGLVTSAFIYLNLAPTTKEKLVQQPGVSLTDVLENKFYAKRSNATWISDTELLYKDARSNVVIFDIVTNQTRILAGVDIPAVAASFSHELSPDRRYLLLGRDYQKIFRHSSLARYDIFDLQTNTTYNLTDNYLQLAEWGPVGSSILYIQDNNIYFKPHAQATDDIQITDDGSPNIYNGICDWVYEEEVFSTKTAVWISPDNRQMAYVQFDDTPVQHINIPVYGIPGVPRDQYPQAIDFPYPKTGSPNPLVKLFVVNLEDISPNRQVQKVQVLAPPELRDIQHIISVVSWANNDEMIAAWMNRVQNFTIVQSCKGIACRNLLILSSLSGWTDFFTAPKFNKDGSYFAYIAPQEQKGLNDSYKHLTLVSMQSGKQIALTSGQHVVYDVLHWDHEHNYIYYTANQPNASQIKHVWSVLANESIAGERPTHCLTCDINRVGVPQTYFEATFSPNGKHAIVNNEGPSIPRTDIVRIASPEASGLLFVRNWEDNSALHMHLANISKPIIRYETIPLGHGFDAVVKLQIPPNADLSGKVKYPMLVDVYGGPGSYSGSDRWETTFSTYLVTNRSFIVAQINGRGSGNRGEKLLHTIYRKMGTVEVEDQILTVKKLTEMYNFIDKNHVGIWGWSYGGFAAGMVLADDDSHVFRCAASVAPVTDWIYYDTIYTERYMCLPYEEDNHEGYVRARLSTRFNSFRNKTYMLVHGSLDDNVHYQQSMALARSLEVNDIPFEQITYPDEDHSLWGVRKHLYHALDKYFSTCFAN